MTETRFTWRWLFVFAAVGVAAGAVLGLIIGWAAPLGGGASVNVASLSASSQNDYITLVANSFAFDNDLPHAKSRLDLLKDSNIKARVEILAKALNTRQDPYAANVADLAVALGSTDSTLQVLAAQITNATGGEPTKVARVEAPPTATPKPTKAATDTPAATATSQEPTDTPVKPTKAAAAAVKNTPAPKAQPTNPPAPAAAALQPEIQPDLSQWWDTKYVPANVAAGQQYWRLKYARYCDWSPDEGHNTCPGMPGGIMDHTIYIMALDPSGGCASNPTIKIGMNDGSTAEYGADKAKPIPYPWYTSSPCLTDWEKEMYGEGNTISIEGLPSDQITNLVLCSKNQPAGYNPPPCGHAHVHYFLVFQQATR
jgi:hypothetical protein